MNQIYAIDSTRVSHREFWWGTKSPLVILGWITKWLRIRIPSSTDDPNFESTTPWVIDALPEEVMARFQPLGAELASLGFYDVAYHCFRDPGTQTTIYWATFLHDSGTHFARIHQRIWGQSQKVSRALFPMFFTEFTDGTFFVSSSGKPDMATPDTAQMNRMHNAPTLKLWEAHQQLAASFGAQKSPVRVASPEEALAATERHHVLVRDFNLARGVFRGRDATEQGRADADAATIAQAQVSGFQYPEVLVELNRLQEKKKPSWTNALWLLLFSIIAFVFVAKAQWNWKFAIWLVPVLLLHETGHWVAMRIFGYRNLRMFFIPFFGAAVSGQHWNVAGWKKAIVSLAGPVPGILLGCALAIVSFFVNAEWLRYATYLLLAINGFNLLPVLPLDGGHVLHATLFCRNRWLDIAFRIAAICGLLLLGLVASKIFLYIAIALGIGLPLAFKMGKVVDGLRNQPVPPPLPSSARIPDETAQSIVTALKQEQPKGVTNKLLAQQAVTIYETLNARPPNVPATLGLLAVHGGSFLLAVIFGFILMMSKYAGNFGDLLDTAMSQPQHEVSCQQPVENWRGAQAVVPGAPRNLLVTTFPRRADAARTYSNLTERLPATASLSLFGDSLLLMLPGDDDAAREKWFGQMQARSTNTFVVVSNRPVTVSLLFIAPDAETATNMTQELNAYGALAGAHLIAPWSAEARQPDYQKYLAARQAWSRLERNEINFWTEPEAKALNKRIAAARKRGAMTEADQLSTEREELLKNLQAKHREKIRAELAGTPAVALVDLNAQLAALNYTNRAERAMLMRQIAAHLGELPYDGNRPAPAATAQGGFMGGAMNHGLIVNVIWGSLADPQTSLPLLLDWLCEHKCTGIKYDFQDSDFSDYLDMGDEEAPAP